MKRFIFTGIIILFVMAGCGGGHSSTDGLITVDVNDSYSTKKELVLQDFMDVEYIPLETNDEFVNQGCVQAVGEKYILVKNYRNDGDIFVYDRNGKAIRKINRKGQGGEEYTSCRSVTLDEENNEMFINDFWTRKIKVYDLEGNFKAWVYDVICEVNIVESIHYRPDTEDYTQIIPEICLSDLSH